MKAIIRVNTNISSRMYMLLSSRIYLLVLEVWVLTKFLPLSHLWQRRLFPSLPPTLTIPVAKHHGPIYLPAFLLLIRFTKNISSGIRNNSFVFEFCMPRLGLFCCKGPDPSVFRHRNIQFLNFESASSQGTLLHSAPLYLLFITLCSQVVKCDVLC